MSPGVSILLLAAVRAQDYAWLIFVGLVALFILAARYYERKRREELAQRAAEMGFSFDPEAKFDRLEGFLELPLLKRNSGLSNLLRGTSSAGEAVVLDCRVGSGKHAYTQTVACFHLRGRTLPHFELRPENIFHKIGSAFGYKDVDFEASPEFSSRYLLRGVDEAGVRELFQPNVLAFFTERKGWSVEGGGEWLGVCRQGQRIKPRDLSTFLQEVSDICQAFAGTARGGGWS